MVDLHQQRIRCTLVDSFTQALRIGDEEIITDDLYLVADLAGEVNVAVPVIFIQWVLDRHDWVLVDQFGIDLCHFLAGQLRAFELIRAVVVELRRCHV